MKIEVRGHSTFPCWLSSDFVNASIVPRCSYFGSARADWNSKLSSAYYAGHSVERFGSGTLDNRDRPVHVWVPEARSNRCRNKSDFDAQFLSHSVGSVYLPSCFRIVQ